MQIRKWYADCVSTDGDVCMAYAARIGLGPLSVPYQAILIGERGDPLSQRTALTSRQGPRVGGDDATWRCPGLDLEGTWSRTSPPFRLVLLDTPSVTIEWLCHMPGASAAVRAGSRAFEGLGYLEELRVSGNPMAIPIRELRWGRFLGESDSVVWIDWSGPKPLTVVLHDGIEVADGQVTDEAVSFSGFRLGLGGAERWTLRDEVAEESVFPNRAWLRPLLPRALAHLHEVKWAAPGSLRRPDGTRSPGWVVYERVVWP